MLNPLAIPKPVSDKLAELNELIERNPLYIPLIEAARFLGMDDDGLRASIEHGACPFGLGWKKDLGATGHLKSQPRRFISGIPRVVLFGGQPDGQNPQREGEKMPRNRRPKKRSQLQTEWQDRQEREAKIKWLEGE
ncbi:hypothetical protein [Anaerotruncus rubiinfantis]|uniref:hypothetical protein n=1 Tax=Anaerotruncus rubiinfantis TaxID=1720200 RepID=UPI003D797C31